MDATGDGATTQDEFPNAVTKMAELRLETVVGTEVEIKSVRAAVVSARSDRRFAESSRDAGHVELAARQCGALG